MKHVTVLQTQAVDMLDLKPQSIVVDATYGAGGHALEICSRLGNKGIYIGIDADKTALLNRAEELQKTKPRIHLINDNFSNLEKILGSLDIDKVDAILADLGWHTDQFVDGKKGFSFALDEPLLMTYGDPKSYPFTAYDIINDWDEETIANILYGYSDERFARRIARAIVKHRNLKPIETTQQLSAVIASAVPKHRGGINPATKSFQAIRIAVNDELGSLQEFIDQAVNLLSDNGHLAIITFHSIEDRLVKLRFRELSAGDEFALLTKKPLTPNEEELLTNKRARSAKLRVIKKI